MPFFVTFLSFHLTESIKNNIKLKLIKVLPTCCRSHQDVLRNLLLGHLDQKSMSGLTSYLFKLGFFCWTEEHLIQSQKCCTQSSDVADCRCWTEEHWSKSQKCHTQSSDVVNYWPIQKCHTQSSDVNYWPVQKCHTQSSDVVDYWPVFLMSCCCLYQLYSLCVCVLACNIFRYFHCDIYCMSFLFTVVPVL